MISPPKRTAFANSRSGCIFQISAATTLGAPLAERPSSAPACLQERGLLVSSRPNGFLRGLSTRDQAALNAVATVRPFAQGEVLAEIGTPMDRVFFINSGMISVIVPLRDGSAIEAGVMGRGDVLGASAAFGCERHVNTAVVQMAGSASVVSAIDLKKAAEASSDIRRGLADQVQLLLAQAQQTAACNTRHRISQRLGTWLLRISDRVQQDELQLTQEYLSQMLGVQRASVSLAAAQLQDEGIIQYRRGRIRLTDRKRLEHVACECYSALRKQYDRSVQTP